MASSRFPSRLLCLSFGVLIAAARLAVGADSVKTDPPKFEVRAERNLAYYTGADAMLNGLVAALALLLTALD